MRHVQCISRFSRSISGLAALEFAFIAPIFVTLFLGLNALYTEGKAQREVQQATATLSDVVARYITMDDTKLQALGVAAEGLLQNTTSLENVRVAVANFYNPPGRYQHDYTLLWSKTVNGATPIETHDIRGDLNNLPIVRRKWGTNSFGDTMVIVRVEVDYDPIIEIPGLSESNTITRIAWAYPRYAQAIDYLE